MKNPRIERALPLLSAVMLTVILVGTAAAANGWFFFVYQYTPPNVGNLEKTANFTLKAEPAVEVYINDPTMTIIGSQYTGVEHEVYVTVSHSRADIDPYNYFHLSCDVLAVLDLSQEVIASYSINNLPRDTTNDYFGVWTPLSQPADYNILLTISGYQWTEIHDAIYNDADIIVTDEDAGLYIRDEFFVSNIVQDGGTVETGFDFFLQFAKSTAEYTIIDNGVTVVSWTDIGSQPAGTYPITESWTVSGTGIHIVEMRSRGS